MQLNTEAINELTDHLEQCAEVEVNDHRWGMLGPAFNMAQIQYHCGAPACLLGHNAILHGRDCAGLVGDLGLAEDAGDHRRPGRGVVLAGNTITPTTSLTQASPASSPRRTRSRSSATWPGRGMWIGGSRGKIRR